MTTQEKIERIKNLQTQEELHKSNKNFRELINIYDEIMGLSQASGIHMDIIPKKAYCHARLGEKKKAEEVLDDLSKFRVFMDENIIFRNFTLISFFLDNTPSDLMPFQINTIKSWLKDPEASKQVKKIIFDYEEFI